MPKGLYQRTKETKIKKEGGAGVPFNGFNLKIPKEGLSVSGDNGKQNKIEERIKCKHHFVSPAIGGFPGHPHIHPGGGEQFCLDCKKTLSEIIEEAKKELKKGESWRRGYQMGYEEGKRETKKQIYNKIVDEWADSAEIKLNQIKRIIEKLK